MNELTKGSKFTYIDSNNKTKECDILCDLETNAKMVALNFMQHHTYLMKMIEY